MGEKKLNKKKKAFSFDWLIGGVLTKIGDTFDRLTGRGYKPSSSLATSELIERLKLLLDGEVKETAGNGRFVPQNIKLKMQWDKFSADSEEAIQALENELHIAAIDHINDQRYHTYAPINIEIKPDYFTEGVKLLASFDKFDEDEHEAAVSVTVPELKIEGLTSPEEKIFEEDREKFVVSFSLKGKPKQIEFAFELGARKSIGRTKENDLVLDDISVSKIHAAFVLNSQNQLMLADTGSTNGTFINGRRIAYGRAFPINGGDMLRFGTVEVALQHLPKISEQLRVEEEENVSEMAKTEQKVLSETSSISEVFSGDGDLKSIRESKKQGEKLTKNEFGKNSKPEKPKEFPTDVNFSVEEDIPKSKEKTDEDELNPTKPGIVFDFDEK